MFNRCWSISHAPVVAARSYPMTVCVLFLCFVYLLFLGRGRFFPIILYHYCRFLLLLVCRVYLARFPPRIMFCYPVTTGCILTAQLFFVRNQSKSRLIMNTKHPPSVMPLSDDIILNRIMSFAAVRNEA